MFSPPSEPPERATRAGRHRRAIRGPAGAVGAGLAALVLLTLSACVADWGAGTSASTGTPCQATARTKVPQPKPAQLEAAGFDALPLAPDAKRVDLVAAPFSRPTEVTNPLFPISELQSVVLNGLVEGLPFRTETTLMPETRIIEWLPGHCVTTAISQYTAYLDSRIEEVAIDHYAQADDGSVWYLGEEVYNYADGVIAETSGTWLAGKEGPAAMIMPGRPRVGQALRPENIPGLVFEEVVVTDVDVTVDGPRGRVRGALVASELHSDGTISDKVFAPGYGEFSSADSGDLEALAIAVPIDALPGPVPGALKDLGDSALAVFDAAGEPDWPAAAAALARLTSAWTAQADTGEVPPRLVAPTDAAVAELTLAVAAQDGYLARDAALLALQCALDLQLQYLDAAEVDRARFELWAHRVINDAAEPSLSKVAGDVSTLEWIRDRIVRTLEAAELTRVDALLEELRAGASEHDLAAATDAAAELLDVVEGAGFAAQ
ncbi:hypothetical protein [Agromyces sp. Soil535]|uniref:hypothetical protein n=1 Tax=Agromyces sp. Soil535 TaxID=1736390 RepID=UPI0006F56699|nr:hypothetical protein [Agromyces sp. Soil535]KRE26106.1 hypothetical protein ASG80_04685 [Agromyces sp. Soil535]